MTLDCGKSLPEYRPLGKLTSVQFLVLYPRLVTIPPWVGSSVGIRHFATTRQAVIRLYSWGKMIANDDQFRNSLVCICKAILALMALLVIIWAIAQLLKLLFIILFLLFILGVDRGRRGRRK